MALANSKKGQPQVSEGQSLIHYWSVMTMLNRYHDFLALVDESSPTDMRHFVCASEFLYWARVVDEGFERILGESYSTSRSQSHDGRYVDAIALVRNKATHSLATVVDSQHDRLDIDFKLDSSPIGPYLRWANLEEIRNSAIDYRPEPGREALYRELLEGKMLKTGLDACCRWLSEVRYDYRNPDWAKGWIAAQDLLPENNVDPSS